MTGGTPGKSKGPKTKLAVSKALVNGDTTTSSILYFLGFASFTNAIFLFNSLHCAAPLADKRASTKVIYILIIPKLNYYRNYYKITCCDFTG